MKSDCSSYAEDYLTSFDDVAEAQKAAGDKPAAIATLQQKLAVSAAARGRYSDKQVFEEQDASTRDEIDQLSAPALEVRVVE